MVNYNNVILDGKEREVSPLPIGNCGFCSHFKSTGAFGKTGSCKAFDRVPLKIWHGEVSHFKSYPNDRGYRFKLKRGMKERYENDQQIQRLKKQWDKE